MATAVRRQRLPRQRLVRRRADYVAIQTGGRRIGGAHYLMFARTSSADETAPGRVGITVSRKIGNAVARNRVKRWVRESCRKALLNELPAGLDVVIVARPSAASAGLGPTAQELASLMRRLRTR